MEILVVGNCRSAADRIRTALERLGRSSTIGQTRDEFSMLVESGRFPIVFAEWRLTGFDGAELCRLIRDGSAEASIHLIFWAPKADREACLQAFQAGADDFLALPFDSHELEARLLAAERIMNLRTGLRESTEEIRRLARALEEKDRKHLEEGMVDPLTGLKNRRFFQAALDSNYALSARTGMTLSLVLIRIDRFQAYAEAFGRSSGESLLRQLAGFLGAAVREHDLAARLENESFVLLLPATEIEDARKVAERIRATIDDHRGARRLFTAAFGVASTGRDVFDSADLFERAEQALEHSKRQGGDCVTRSTEPERFGMLRAFPEY